MSFGFGGWTLKNKAPWHIRLEPPAPKKVFQHHRKNKNGNLFLVPGVMLDFEVALFLFEGIYL